LSYGVKVANFTVENSEKYSVFEDIFIFLMNKGLQSISRISFLSQKMHIFEHETDNI